MSKKKFNITRRWEIPRQVGKLKIVVKSRPQKCPLCNSEGTIIKKNNQWKCDTEKKGCGHTW